MGWVFSGLEHQELERSYSDWQLLKKIMSEVIPFKNSFIFIIIMVIVGTIINLATPLVLTEAIKLITQDSSNNQLILGLAVLYLILYIVNFTSYFGINFAMAKLVPDFMVNLRTRVFDSIQKQDLKFFDKKRSGKLTSRVGADAAESANIVFVMSTFGGNVLLIFVTFFILFAVSKPLAILTLAVVPFIIATTLIFRKVARKVSKTYRKSIANVNAAISESVEGIQIAKSFGREKETTNKFRVVNNENVDAGLKQGVTMEFIGPTIDIFAVLGIYLIVQYGGTWTILNQNNIDTASLYLFILYLNRFFFPLMQLSTFYSQLQAGFAAYERIVEVQEAVPEVDLNHDGKLISDFRGKIEFIDTTFGYKENEPILSEFNLTIEPGEKIAIVGHTGAGKTTITNIIARFYEFQGGKVLIDGYDIRALNLKEYRRHLGIVQQEPFLFSGTVEANIRYGNQEATDEELSQTIRAVHAEEFLQYLPNGLQTEVGERGNRLSTGQRQLVCFARALLANPNIIILDEATSAVDAYTEAVIQEALETLFEGRTSIVIAHRLSTIVNADRILVMDHGKIIEEGSHNALMKQEGKYQELYQTYFRHQSLAIKAD